MRRAPAPIRPRPECGHTRLVQCGLTVDDWAEVYRAWLGFLHTCRLIAARAHARAEGI